MNTQRTDQTLAWLNGRVIPFSEAKLPVSDVGVVHGASVTEMARTFHGVPFRLNDHLNRLFASVRAVGFDTEYGRDRLQAVVHELVEHNFRLIPPTHDLGVILFVTGGPNPTYLPAVERRAAPPSTVCVHTFILQFESWADQLVNGRHLITSTVRQIPAESVDPRIKSRSRLHWRLADHQVRQIDPAAGALVLTADELVAETSAANVFIVSRGRVRTPARGVLEGVSRATVIELCNELGIDCTPADLIPDDVAASDEVFTTSTPCCMLPVTRFNGQPIGNGKPGPIFARLAREWSDRVGVDIIRQAREAAGQLGLRNA